MAAKNIPQIMSLIRKEFKGSKKPTVRRTSEKRDPFRTLIACLLSLRTRDENTAKASSTLFKVADTPEKISGLPIKKLEKLIYSSGFYKNKAKAINHVSNVILKEYGGKVPRTEEELLSIKGIGRKTCNIVRLFAYNELTLPIDVNCHRIANRLGWVKTNNADKTEFELKKILPKEYWPEFNTLFILFGKKICVPISPFCSRCPVKEFCPKIGVGKSR
ncbi:endonuclease III [Candidatus Woesearchaeota archaeon]|nr:endonuclease III [Candidatus Woesearchaeota archaeon]